MSTPSVTTLGPKEVYPGRPFTDVRNTEADLATLDFIRAHLHALIHGLLPCVNDGQLQGRTPRGRYRIVLLQRNALLGNDQLTVVGFCGQRRQDADPVPLMGVDAELVAELQHHPYMLAYCSHEQSDGNWINLVVMDATAQLQRWRESVRHIYAARQLSPDYYASIRLHAGILPQGLASPGIQLSRTMYYDFSAGWWQAMRVTEHGPPL
jgi:hypothetical protein